mmetsp:Transcript_4953/g.6103  ORF Transcript_4953/g.6103 Transcript_4953/m.6103 type:complete len:93 (+) Transcript_4953:245-523(+)
MYDCIYSPQVLPSSGVNLSNSLSEQVTSEFASATDKIADTKYEKGLHLYMKIQNLGIASEEAKIPQNVKHIVNSKDDKFAALSANSMNEIHS